MGILAREPLLSALPPADRAALLAAGAHRHFGAADRLIQQGMADDFVIAISDGWASVRADAANGRAFLLALCGPGDVVGELSVLDGGPHNATVTALTALETHVVSGESFRRFLANHATAGVALLHGMALRLRAIDAHGQDLATLPVAQRLARLLITLDQDGPHHPPAIRLPQQELAAAIGATRESVAKCLAALRAQGVLVTAGRQITVVDRPALAAIAGV
ncbi:CRP/FNR family cyclic AMP-dependent transcriptional regulator [Catenulispora sp. MAP12-49]|uniref:Crp/Fnr family transcriptional regulator n=1 Tax=unclassified Catenulispora TaxID=414885 RepID=UPI00351977DB